MTTEELEQKLKALEQRVEELETVGWKLVRTDNREGEPVPGCPQLVTVPCGNDGDITITYGADIGRDVVLP